MISTHSTVSSSTHLPVSSLSVHLAISVASARPECSDDTHSSRDTFNHLTVDSSALSCSSRASPWLYRSSSSSCRRSHAQSCITMATTKPTGQLTFIYLFYYKMPGMLPSPHPSPKGKYWKGNYQDLLKLKLHSTSWVKLISFQFHRVFLHFYVKVWSWSCWAPWHHSYHHRSVMFKTGRIGKTSLLPISSSCLHFTIMLFWMWTMIEATWSVMWL